MRKKTIKIYLWVLSIGLLYLGWVILTNIQIPCFYLKTLGMECPGCGATRMFVSILKLDFVSAFHYNPAMFVLFFLWNIIGAICIWDKVEFIKTHKFLYTTMFVSIAVMVGYGIIRNL